MKKKNIFLYIGVISLINIGIFSPIIANNLTLKKLKNSSIKITRNNDYIKPLTNSNILNIRVQSTDKQNEISTSGTESKTFYSTTQDVDISNIFKYVIGDLNEPRNIFKDVKILFNSSISKVNLKIHSDFPGPFSGDGEKQETIYENSGTMNNQFNFLDNSENLNIYYNNRSIRFHTYYGDHTDLTEFKVYLTKSSINSMKLKASYQLKVVDNWHAGGKSHAYPISIWFLDNSDNSASFQINAHLPYTSNDLLQFKELFKQVVAAPIRLKNVKNPILFDFNNDGTNDVDSNEYKVRKIIEQRAQEFYASNPNIVNKLGFISNNGKQVLDVSHIKLYVDPSKRGKSGSQTVDVRFNLGHDIDKNKISINSYDETKKFYFDDNEAKSYYSVQLKINIQLDPTVDVEIDKLVHIIPFKSASNEFEMSYMVQKDLRMELGDNDPDPLSINSFKIDINKIDNNGYYESLIPREKLPVINKVGTYISLDLEINIEGNIINKTIRFDHLFNNGTIYTTLNLNESDYLQNTNFKILNNQIHLGLEMNQNKIYLFNSAPIRLTSSINSDNLANKLNQVKINVKKASVQIPSEQITRNSKWIQIKDEELFEKEKLQFKGEFKTYDPFIFRLDVLNLPLYDPITGEFIGYSSKYKPFLRKGEFDKTNVGKPTSDDDTIFPTPQLSEDGNAYYEANLGAYVMKNKAEAINGEFKFQIVIKEFDESNKSENLVEKYTKDRWVINISMNLLTSKANFVMSGYQDNKLIKDENEQKYFNEEHPDYRGDFVDEKTGMYKPKIVWVNSYPPEAFLYDPVDSEGNLIVDKNLSSNEYEEASRKAKYDIGYIAELNAAGFVKSDYASLPTFGGYETFFDTNVFKPTGLMPYSEFYTYNKYSTVPTIERIPLSQSGLQTTKSTSNFRQIVLKRTNSDSYLYQFVKIPENSTQIRNNHDLVSLYGTLYGLQNKPLFVDFWDTYQGKHLMNYLVNDFKLIESEDKVKSLSYEDIVQYWNLYVNDPSHYNNEQENPNKKDYDLSEIKLNSFELKINDFNLLKNEIIRRVTSQLEAALINKGWFSSNFKLKYNTHFKIEETFEEFDEKIRLLLNEYNKPLNEAKFIELNIISIEDGYKTMADNLIIPSGITKIKILNNKDADKIIDLSKYTGSKLSINTSNHTLPIHLIWLKQLEN